MTERDADGRFIKGVSGNPNGRKTKEREEKYRDILREAVTFEDFRRIILKARDQALKGDAVARKFLADYLVGPPIQRNEHTGEDGQAIRVEYVNSPYPTSDVSSSASYDISEPKEV